MDQVDRWLSLMDGPGWEGRERRDLAIEEMRQLGTDEAIRLLSARLYDEDVDTRCNAVTALFFLDARRAFELAVPLTNDADRIVRWHVCGCLHDFGDERAVNALTAVMHDDADAQNRGTAAYALGGIGSPAAIPALLRALEFDHECDMHGHSASSCAARALDEILGTSETRIRVSDSICKLPSKRPDVENLKERAMSLYESWSADRQQRFPPR